MRVERYVTIGCPVDRVFAFVSTPENDPLWVPVSVRHEKTSPGPMAVGATTEEDVKFIGRRMRYTWEVTEFQPPYAFAIRSLSGAIPSTIRVALQPVGDATRLVLTTETALIGPYKLAGPLMTLAIGQLFQRQLRKLKGLLEGR